MNYLKFILLLTISFITTVVINGQTFKTDLARNFTRVETVSLDAASARENANNRKPVKVKDFNLVLTPHNLKAKNYTAQFEPREITTFKGTIENEPNSIVRLRLDGKTIEGYIITNGETLFIEPAKKYSRRARLSEYVLYNEKN